LTSAAAHSLLALSAHERLEALTELIVPEFRTALRLEPGEPFAVDARYFELGLTSLQLTEIKKRLEEAIGVTISSNVLFNQPTVAQLTAYLAHAALPGTDTATRGAGDAAPSGPGTRDRALLAEIFPELNQA
jgi:acyl carrier protein